MSESLKLEGGSKPESKKMSPQEGLGACSPGKGFIREIECGAICNPLVLEQFVVTYDSA